MSDEETLSELGLPLYGLRTWMLGSRVLSFDVTPQGKLELRVEDRVLRRFPTGASRDDDELLEAAKEEWDALKVEARAAIKRAKALLRSAMKKQTPWSVADFEAQIMNHALMRRLGSRLVWAGLDAEGQTICYGRLLLHGAWDLGPGRPPELPEEVVAIYLPRGAELPEEVLASWSARFSKQPIKQLPLSK